MPVVEASVIVNAPARIVYDAAKEFERLVEHLDEVESVKVVERTPARSVTDWVATAAGRRVQWTEVEEWDDSTLSNRFHSPKGDFSKYEGTWRFEAEGDAATRVHLSVDYEINIPLLGPLLHGLIKTLMAKNTRAFVEALRRSVESG
jgi:ribosome-associated toxin RatA of RatAB toxin-antitoxin module